MSTLTARQQALLDGNHTAAEFVLSLPEQVFGDSAGDRVRDAYEALVQGLSSGKSEDKRVIAAIQELQYQANMHNNAAAKTILAALDEFGLAPAGSYDEKLAIAHKPNPLKLSDTPGPDPNAQLKTPEMQKLRVEALALAQRIRKPTKPAANDPSKPKRRSPNFGELLLELELG